MQTYMVPLQFQYRNQFRIAITHMSNIELSSYYTKMYDNSLNVELEFFSGTHISD